MSPLDALRDRLVPPDEVLAVLQAMGVTMARSTWYDAMKQNRVPGVVRLSARRIVLNGSVVAAWLSGVTESPRAALLGAREGDGATPSPKASMRVVS